MVSIIIIFQDEDFSVIKRAVQSVMSAGPYKLIYEVLLIADVSKEENIDPLYDFGDRWEGLGLIDKINPYSISCTSKLHLLLRFLLHWRPTKGVVKVKRLPEQIGSIAAKTQAAKEASGKILGRF